MKKCSPIQMRASLEMVEALKREQLDFVPIPVINSEHGAKLIEQMQDALEEIVKKLEATEAHNTQSQ